jgi:hypothetical protein
VLGTSLNETQLERLREQVKTAHGRGIKVRYWDQPGWPVGTRDAIVSAIFCFCSVSGRKVFHRQFVERRGEMRRRMSIAHLLFL